jgi:hypothetical protein
VSPVTVISRGFGSSGSWWAGRLPRIYDAKGAKRLVCNDRLTVGGDGLDTVAADPLFRILQQRGSELDRRVPRHARVTPSPAQTKQGALSECNDANPSRATNIIYSGFQGSVWTSIRSLLAGVPFTVKAIRRNSAQTTGS